MRFNVGDKVFSTTPRDLGVGTVLRARGRWGVQLYGVEWRDRAGNRRLLSMPEEMLQPATDEADRARHDAETTR